MVAWRVGRGPSKSSNRGDVCGILRSVSLTQTSQPSQLLYMHYHIVSHVYQAPPGTRGFTAPSSIPDHREATSVCILSMLVNVLQFHICDQGPGAGHCVVCLPGLRAMPFAPVGLKLS